MGTDQARAVAYVSLRTRPSERIFVGTSRHDRIFANDVSFYFLAARHSATRFHELVPGVATTLPVQREIVADLERHGARYLVLSRQFEGYAEPNLSARSSGVTILDDYIARRYRVVEEFGAYSVWARRSDGILR